MRRLRAPAIATILEDFAQEERARSASRTTRRITDLPASVTSSKTKTTKNNSLMAYVVVEDDTASIELLCFSPGAGELRCLPAGKSGGGGKGTALRPG